MWEHPCGDGTVLVFGVWGLTVCGCLPCLSSMCWLFLPWQRVWWVWWWREPALGGEQAGPPLCSVAVSTLLWSGVCFLVVEVQYPRPLLSCGVNKWVRGSPTEAGALSLPLLEYPLGSALCGVTWNPLLQAHKGHCFGHCHQPCSNRGNASNHLCPMGALFTRPPVQNHRSRVPGPQQSYTWAHQGNHGGRSDPSLLSWARAQASRARPVPAAGAPAVHLDVL